MKPTGLYSIRAMKPLMSAGIVFFSLQASAADFESSVNPQINEIRVSPEESLVNLRLELQAAERNVYDIFNRLNDEDRFTIHCSINAPTGSNLKLQTCQVQFEIEAQRVHGRAYFENMRDFYDEFTEPNTSQTAHIPQEALIAYHQRAYREKMRTIAEEHPEFLEAVVRYTSIKERLETGRVEH